MMVWETIISTRMMKIRRWSFSLSNMALLNVRDLDLLDERITARHARRCLFWVGWCAVCRAEPDVIVPDRSRRPIERQHPVCGQRSQAVLAVFDVCSQNVLIMHEDGVVLAGVGR